MEVDELKGGRVHAKYAKDEHEEEDHEAGDGEGGGEGGIRRQVAGVFKVETMSEQDLEWSEVEWRGVKWTCVRGVVPCLVCLGVLACVCSRPTHK
ncbi:hypothetical protein E2C01_053319 [Portunus trituberculatus]|uniref:Uncharacterized protein n=1 Tax=Portunus trituberculatus TaxID=210409 RepID=A0A5B7GP19_PORTR|nr:hypothetical protein [Portunus trituberculatus]